MISKISKAMVIAVTMATVALLLSAQNGVSISQNPHMLTGCMQRGEAVSAYKLNTPDGAWNLSFNKKIKMAKYLDHTVTVSGTVVESPATKSADANAVKKSPGNIFNVTKITVIGPTCST